MFIYGSFTTACFCEEAFVAVEFFSRDSFYTPLTWQGHFGLVNKNCHLKQGYTETIMHIRSESAVKYKKLQVHVYS